MIHGKEEKKGEWHFYKEGDLLVSSQLRLNKLVVENNFTIKFFVDEFSSKFGFSEFSKARKLRCPGIQVLSFLALEFPYEREKFSQG